MKKINIKIQENCPGPQAPPHAADNTMPNAHVGEEGRLHRTTLAHMIADAKVLLDLVEDGDNLPEWLEAKITKAGDYMSSAARYIAGNIAREYGQLEESSINHNFMCMVDTHYNLYESLQNAVSEDNEKPCVQCLYEILSDASCGCPNLIPEDKYNGRIVTLNKPFRGGRTKFQVFVREANSDKVRNVHFGSRRTENTTIARHRFPFTVLHSCKTTKEDSEKSPWPCREW